MGNRRSYSYLVFCFLAVVSLLAAGCGGGTNPQPTGSGSPISLQPTSSASPATQGSPTSTVEPPVTPSPIAGRTEPGDFGDRAKTEKTKEGKMRFVHKHSGLSITYPAGWKTELTQNQDGALLTHAKLPGVTIKSFSFSRGDRTVESEITKLEVGETLKRAGKEEKLKISGHDAVCRIYTKVENPNDENRKELKILGTFFSVKSDVFVILCYSPKATFEKNLPLFKSVTATLGIKPVIPAAPFKPNAGGDVQPKEPPTAPTAKEPAAAPAAKEPMKEPAAAPAAKEPMKEPAAAPAAKEPAKGPAVPEKAPAEGVKAPAKK